MKSYKFISIGRVQGVYYRANIQKNASKAGFNGYVKNLNDGTVESCVTCEESRFEEFKNILKKAHLQVLWKNFKCKNAMKFLKMDL